MDNNKFSGIKRLPASWLTIVLGVVLIFGVQNSSANQHDALLVLDISERAYDGGNALAVTFNLAIDGGQNIDDYLKLSSNAAGSVDGSWELAENLRVAYFPHAEPNTRYTINIYPGLESISGLRLKKQYEKSIKTRNIIPSVTFPSNGNFLSLNLSDGLPVTAVNVDEVNIDFFRVGDKQISRFLDFMSEYSSGGWPNWRLDKAVAHGEMVYSGRFDLDYQVNKRRNSHIPLADISPLSQPGVYIAVMSPPGEYYKKQAGQLFYGYRSGFACAYL